MNQSKHLIYKGSQIDLYIDDVSTDNVIFTFSGHGANPKNLYGDGFIQKHGFSGVFFVALNNHWWQTEELYEAIKIANEYTKNHSNRITYGQSMGAYGALLCASKLRSRVVVTAPQTSINPSEVPLPKIWLDDINKFPKITQPLEIELLATPSINIIYDPKDKCDIAHATHLRNHIPWVNEYKVPYLTHNLPQSLKEMEIISDVIPDFFKNTQIEKSSLRNKIRTNRIKSTTYLKAVGESVKKSKNKWLYDLYKEIVSSRMQFIFNDSTLDQINIFDKYSLSINQSIETFDINQLIFLIKNSSAQITISKIPEGSKKLFLNFYSNTDSRGSNSFNSENNDSALTQSQIFFNVKKGFNSIEINLETNEISPNSIKISPTLTPAIIKIQDILFR